MTASPATEQHPAHRRSAAARSAETSADAARPQPRSLPGRFFRLVGDVWRKANRDRVLGLAGENAFMAVLTVFPTLLVFAALLGQLSSVIGDGNTDQVKKAIRDFLKTILTSSASDVDSTVNKLFSTHGNAFTLALVLALVLVAQAFASVLNTVTLTYDVDDHRGYFYRRLIGLLLGLGSLAAGAVLITAFVLGPFFGAKDVGFSADYAFIWSWVRYPVAFVALVGWATTLYHVCPDRPAGWREGVPGALLAAFLWGGASYGLSTYLQLVVPDSPLLGALGGGLILMTWLYLLCFGLLVGAELNATLLARKALRETAE